MIQESVRIPEELNIKPFRETWTTWVQYRKETHHPLRPTGIKLLLKKLTKYSPDVAVAMLTQSMENGWQGVFEVKRLMREKVDRKNVLSPELLNFVRLKLKKELSFHPDENDLHQFVLSVKDFYHSQPGESGSGSYKEGGIKYFIPSVKLFILGYLQFLNGKFDSPLRLIKVIMPGSTMWNWYMDTLGIQTKGNDL